VKCAACKGSAHPDTGCQYTETCLICGPCVRRFWEWASGNGSRKFRVGPKRKGAEYVPFPTGATR
jgi:hypothetical protein